MQSRVVALGLPAASVRSAPVRGSAATLDDGRPDRPELIDRYGRIARDLRVSITERCSLRCTYCMPEEGLPVIPEQRLLSTDEIVRLVGIAVDDLGVREMRLTGGEPLMRRDLVDIVAGCRRRCPDLRISMTSNAVGLARRADALARAGLDRINISLDTVDRVRFADITRRDRLPAVLAGIRAAVAARLAPVKVNAVAHRATLRDASDLLRWCIAEGASLRFIEQMPLDAEHGWRRAEMVTARDVLDELSGSFRLEPIGRDDPSAPAELWRVDGGPAVVGIIGSVTRPFCDDCDRTRLTAEGTVRSCLFGDDEVDLRAALRSGADDATVADLWRGAMWRKPAGHGIDEAGFVPPERSMGQIGG